MPPSSIKPDRPATLRLTFAPDFASARGVSGEIRDFLAEQGMPQNELFSYELCIAEACYNAIEYAQGEAREFRPIAEVLFAGDLVEMRVTDHTAGFVLPERLPPPSPKLERGRGLFVIQSVMDEVRYLRGPSENTLVMRKRRRSAGPAQAPRLDHGVAQPQSPEEGQDELAKSKWDLATAADERSLRSEALSAIFRCCAELGGGDDTADGFSERLLSDLLRLTSAEWYVLRLLSPESRQLTVVAASEPGVAFEAIGLPAAGDAPSSLEASVAVGRKPVKFDARDHTGAEPLTAAGPEGTGLVCPLCFGSELFGTIAVGSRKGDFPLGGLQEEVVLTFAEFLAIQSVSLRRRNEEIRKRVVAHELTVAQEIQQLLLPRTLPQPPGFSLAGGWRSAREVGGDFYDAIGLGAQSLFLMIVDVMGKGVPAALFATTMRGLLRGLASRSSDPAQLLTSLNGLLYKELSAVNMFITAQIVHVDLRERTATIASAGHCPLLIMRPGGKSVSTHTAQGVPLGVLADTVYHHETIALGAPATILMHTDGLTDTRDSDGTMFGQRRLMAWMRANVSQGRSATELRDLLAAEMERFRGETTLTDDQAFLLLSEEGDGDVPAAGLARRRIPFQRGSFLFPATARRRAMLPGAGTPPMSAT
jgi:serine phosphatase RsbU (regulator of sigma subunit)/anti-sigma regulatory factor (Ser/Thr protein kinase)